MKTTLRTLLILISAAASLGIATAYDQDSPVNVILPVPTRVLPALGVITPAQWNASVAIDMLEADRRREQDARDTDARMRALAAPERY
jgi:hypothetical protein